jgi:hypothetical protein
MTRAAQAAKAKPIPVDTVLEEREADRRADLAGNQAYQRGLAAAQRTELANRRAELKTAFADLHRMKTARGSVEASRAGYDRVYARIERLAQVIAGVTGESVEIPAYDPPAVLAAATRRIGPKPATGAVVTRPDGTTATIDPSTAYVERGGRGPSGRGVPGPAVPGSAADHEWADR